MSNTFQPYPWSEFPMECLIYLMFMSVVHLAAFIIGCAFAAPVFGEERGMFRRRVGGLGLFPSLLLVVGSFFNGLWSCTVWGRLYCSTDYVWDFMPFWPVTQRDIDAPFGNERGRLLGVSLFQLQLVWFLFAAGTWGVTIFLYRFIRRHSGLNAPAAAVTMPS
jgi:hypothetical protein